jgi:Xaa-Pro aminopeptidase
MSLAVIKTPTEIQLLRDCAAMTDAGVTGFLGGAHEGADERELGLAVEAAMVRTGADRVAFPPLIFSGPRVENGIGFPAHRRLEHGDQINIVCGALLQGYNMDIGRVTVIGAPSSETRAVMETAAEMLDAMLANTRPGVLGAAIGAAGVDVVRARGMDDWIYRFGSPGYAGHGIGCWLDEPPKLRAGEESRIAAGMVLILEARLGQPGHGGATITDPVVVTETGIERLSKVPIRTWPD